MLAGLIVMVSAASVLPTVFVARTVTTVVPAAVGVASRYDFRGITRVLDVGGGSGCFMVAAAQGHAALRCTVMELPAMCEAAIVMLPQGKAVLRTTCNTPSVVAPSICNSTTLQHVRGTCKHDARPAPCCKPM